MPDSIEHFEVSISSNQPVGMYKLVDPIETEKSHVCPWRKYYMNRTRSERDGFETLLWGENDVVHDPWGDQKGGQVQMGATDIMRPPAVEMSSATEVL